MKHNPRLNEKMARLPGFIDLHPLQPQSTVQGALELMDGVAHWLKTLTGLPAVALPPKAGAHGELCGLLAIRAAHEARGDARRRVLVTTSAHGTNPATAAPSPGYQVEEIAQGPDGRVDLEDLAAKLGPDVAAIMLTNPNTCGLFERDILEIARLTHAAGAYFYCDGANFNAIVGKLRPGDLGVDAMHINLHKTFSTPHGGGGPGAGPVVLSEALAPFAPQPWVVREGEGWRLEEHAAGQAKHGFGRMSAFHGQMGMFVRAYAYMLSHGSDGLRQVAEDAVLNANYIKALLQDLMTPAFPEGPCMHEALFSDEWLEGTRRHHPGLRQGHDRRGLPSHDHVFPPGRARRHADRAHRDGVQGRTRPVLPGAARLGRGRPGRQGRSAQAGPLQGRRSGARAPADGWTRPWPPASRACGGKISPQA